MAGQSEAADDLIAELAKLMAQDAQGDRTAKPDALAPAPVQFPPVRIPGDVTPKPVSNPSTDFLRSLSSARPPAATSEPVRVEPVAAAPTPEVNADPFQFDFNIRAASGPTSGLEDAPVVTTAPAPAASVAPSQEHDSIADLISAEMAAHPQPEPEPAPEFTPPPVVRDVPAAPTPAPSLMSTTVAASPDPQHAPSLGASRPDHDRFRVPPVFGLGSAVPTPAAPVVSAPVVPAPARQPSAPVVTAPQPSAGSNVAPDPIDEIESLIGRAMRVEFDLPEDQARQAEAEVAPVATRPAPSPALRSLATPVLPNRDAENFSVADQTIFAAAHATGAKVGWVNDPVPADPEPQSYSAAPRQRRAMGMSRALAGPLVAITLLLAAGFGLYWVLGLGGREEGPAPLLTADTAPVKEAAPVVAADDAAATQSVVFNEMDGGTPSADEQLVSRDQTDVNEVTQVAATTDTSEEGLANRKVRTVKVRPDGTIVSGDDSVAGSAILPVDRPNVPTVPGAQTATPELLANIEPAATEATATTTPVATAPAADPVASVVPVEPGSTVPAVDLAGTAISGKSATIPLMRPTGLRLASTAPAAADIATATVAPVAEAVPSVTVPGATEVAALGDTAPAYVQLASQRSEADARQSAQNMVTRYGPLFGGANLEVQRVDLGAKGIYYRVRVPAQSMEQANVICTNVKAAGGDCFTM